jgi:hypothetical protein
MFLAKKRSGEIKAHAAKEEVNASKVTSEAIFIQGIIFSLPQVFPGMESSRITITNYGGTHW